MSDAAGQLPIDPLDKPDSPPGKPDPRVFCPFCPSNIPSAVLEGASQTSTMVVQPAYDHTGKYHTHNTNIVTEAYSCTRGHAWRVQSTLGCRNCDWPGAGDESPVIIPPTDPVSTPSVVSYSRRWPEAV
jgi:hypothetical protein